MPYKAIVRNNSDKPKVLWLEPWAEDFVMKPEEEFEIIEERESSVYFYIDFGECISVYVEGARNTDPPIIYSDGKRLECGHHRSLLEKKKLS